MLEVLIQTLQRDFQFYYSSVAESPGFAYWAEISVNCPGESLHDRETSLPLDPTHFSITGPVWTVVEQTTYIQALGMYGVLQQWCPVLQQYKKLLRPMWLQNLDVINPTFNKPLPRMARIQFYISNHNHALGGLSSTQQKLIYRSGVLLGPAAKTVNDSQY